MRTYIMIPEDKNDKVDKLFRSRDGDIFTKASEALYRDLISLCKATAKDLTDNSCYSQQLENALIHLATHLVTPSRIRRKYTLLYRTAIKFKSLLAKEREEGTLKTNPGDIPF